MRVLVTGAGGFLGGEIARRFAARGDIQLIAAGRSQAPAGGFAVDLTDMAQIVRILTHVRPDVVVHAAGRSQGSRDELLRDNSVATANLAEAMRLATPDAALVLLGSAAQYGAANSDRAWRESDVMTPLTHYGQSKLDAETAAFATADSAGLRVSALRLFNVVAPRAVGSQVFAAFLRRAAETVSVGPPPWRVLMGPLGAIRDLVAVSDVVRAVEAVVDRGVWGDAINICTGVGRPVRDLIAATAAAFDGALVVEEGEGDAGVPSSIGDPGLCEARLGFRSSADLSALTREAAAWIREASGARSDA